MSSTHLVDALRITVHDLVARVRYPFVDLCVGHEVRAVECEGQIVGQVRLLFDGSYPGLPAAEIAYLLGFAETSSFNRAFRRWTGKSPSEFRRVEPVPAPAG